MNKISKYFKALLLSLITTLFLFKTASAESNDLFQLDDTDYKATDFSLLFQQSLYNLELKYYKDRVNLVDRALLELELKKAVEESGKTEQQAAIDLFDVAEPSEEDVEKFYKDNKANIDQPFDEVKEQLVAFLKEEAQVKKQGSLLDKIKHNNILTFKFELPIPPLVNVATEGYPSKGADNARAVLVEFADFQCPYCKEAGAALKKTLAKFEDDLKIVYMDFPVNPSGISRKVAEGAACAGKQDKFWEYHDLAFAQQAELTADSALALAEELQLDTDAFNKCLSSDFPAQHVKKAEEEGLRLGVDETPTLFLNGRRLHLHDLETELPMEIEKILNDSSMDS